jgi:hypothetical protein
MPAKSSQRRHAAAVVGALQRHHGPVDPRLANARRDLRAAELEEHVRRIVDDAPPLTAEQRDKIAALLRAPATPALLSRGASST